MFCTPPATTRSWVPDMTPCAAKCTACWEEPHCRSMVTPGHVVGQPGDQPRRARDVAGLRADRVAAAHDHVVDGARVDAGALASSAVSTCAPRSAECTPASAPPRLPTGVRTASTM